MKSILRKKLFTAFILQFSVVAFAHAAGGHSDHHDKHDDGHEQERVEHGSHQHGVARLAIAKTDSGLEITLETPAANLFGFEHQANSDKDRETVVAAKKKLGAGDELFIANSNARCKLDKAEIESEIIAGLEQHKHDEHEKDHHDEHESGKENHDHHDDKHDHDGDEKQDKAAGKDHDHHDDKHDHDDKEKEDTHNDVDATWVFSCKKPDALESVNVALFSQFPNGFEHLNVEWISDNAAGSTELDADGVIKLKK